MENKLRKGLILGGLLAVGATVGFAISKKGQKLSEELQKDLKTLAEQLKRKLHQLEDVTKENFDKLVDTAVAEYTEKKELASDVKKTLTTILQSKWHEMEEEYKS
ncbi:MAG: hypothetical protein WC025_02040 [Candidatus Magasanikbacteria bacterium]